ncbi:MAG TPA: hypothetical protein VG838_18430 [Opitutaceae bacterium]|nr:hypothetical protein [Opitutaceae bacterium]
MKPAALASARQPGPLPAARRTPPRRFSLFLRIALPAVVVLAGLVLLYHRVDISTVQAAAGRLNAGVAFALLVVLPLVGFPVNVLHVAMGLRFGFPLGMALVAASILLQLLASYAIVHAFRGFFARRLAPIREKIPHAAHGTVCLFTLLLPGVPYFIQNYTLALIGVPFRIYLTRCLPLHILRSAVTVGLGGQAAHLRPGGLALLISYWVLLLGASWWTYRRLRRQLANPPAAAGGRKRRA